MNWNGSGFTPSPAARTAALALVVFAVLACPAAPSRCQDVAPENRDWKMYRPERPLAPKGWDLDPTVRAGSAQPGESAVEPFREGPDYLDEEPFAYELAPATSMTARRLVVLDPGHGGMDNGAELGEGLLEKQVVLHLARKIRDRLEEKYRVAMTREDDLAMDPERRAGYANHHEAELFVSLHAGAAWTRTPGHVAVWYHDGAVAFSPFLAEDDLASQHTPWSLLQKKHFEKSHDYARLLGSRLSRRLPDSEPRTGGLPLFLLGGVDAPAVLVEMDTRFLRGPWSEVDRSMDSLADAVADATIQFFGD
ncbi:MAG: N-acetylmuramoyl-L-alanine amidase [Desulfatibacillaceae bacterium]